MTIGKRKTGSLGNNYLNYLSKKAMGSMLTKLSKPPANRAAINHVKVNQGHIQDHRALTSKVKQRLKSKAEEKWPDILAVYSHVNIPKGYNLKSLRIGIYTYIILWQYCVTTVYKVKIELPKPQ